MRNYKENPLKRGEIIPKDELIETYIEKNFSRKDCAEIFNTNEDKIKKCLKYWNIIKPRELTKVHRDKTNLEKYGVSNIFYKKEYIQQKTFEKLGVTNSHYLPEVVEKMKQTNLERYGVDVPAKNEEIKEKQLKTMNEKYGGNAPICSKEIKNKIAKTNQEKYGCASPFGNKNVQEKSKQTIMNKYGTEHAMQNQEVRDKLKHTVQEKYGVNTYTETEKFKEKVQETCREKYGNDYFMGTDSFKNKSKQTCLEKYGVDHPSKTIEIQEKIFETMKKNGSYRSSKPEKEIEKLLKEKYEHVETQYNKDSRYPFLCDFYIPELDLFIEYQGYQGHGGHPFNPNSKEDIDKLNLWIKKATETNYKGKTKEQYLQYISVWTQKDVEKRNIAKQNNLNYLEFFSFDEFMNWYKN